MSWATLYVLLIPAIGYICLSQKNKANKKIKPISGLDLTYHSAVYGAVFLAISFVIVRVVTYLFIIFPNSIQCDFCVHLLSGLDEPIACLILATGISFLWSRRSVPAPEEWEGDAIIGKILLDLMEKDSIVVIFLKNGKCYRGLLMEFDGSERAPWDERIMTLFVLMSGYRNDQGIVEWNTNYNEPLKHHFFMSEIVNFSEYVRDATFKIGRMSHQKMSKAGVGGTPPKRNSKEKP